MELSRTGVYLMVVCILLAVFLCCTMYQGQGQYPTTHETLVNGNVFTIWLGR